MKKMRLYRGAPDLRRFFHGCFLIREYYRAIGGISSKWFPRLETLFLASSSVDSSPTVRESHSQKTPANLPPIGEKDKKEGNPAVVRTFIFLPSSFFLFSPQTLRQKTIQRSHAPSRTLQEKQASRPPILPKNPWLYYITVVPRPAKPERPRPPKGKKAQRDNHPGNASLVLTPPNPPITLPSSPWLCTFFLFPLEKHGDGHCAR